MPEHAAVRSFAHLIGAGLALAVALGVVGCAETRQTDPPASLEQSHPIEARTFYVAPDGAGGNDGSLESPLDLRTALSAQSPAGPGDTIWLRGGVYRGNYVSVLTGTPNAPIKVRGYPGEWAVIDAVQSKEDGLHVQGAWTWYWGFEIYSSEPNRVSTAAFAADINRGGGVVSHAPGAKFINLVVHDMVNGFGIWASSPDAEVYGNLIYHNGYAAADRGHGHGIYAQNREGAQHFVDNILFGGFSHGFHGYGSDAAYLNNFRLEGNIIFDSGMLSPYFARNILIGGGRTAENPVVVENQTFFNASAGTRGGENNFGYSAGCTNLELRGNYMAHLERYPLVLQNCTGEVSNNVFIGWTDEPVVERYPSNTFLRSAPSGVKVFVRPNRYEPGRAHVAVYNWDNRPRVAVDLSTIGLEQGAAFEIRDAQRFFDDPVVSGTFTGAAVDIPLSVREIVRPVGNVPHAPADAPRTFGAFIVLPKASR